MGYTSDVVLVMYPEKPEDMPALKLFASENMADKFEEVKRDSPRIPVYLRWRWDRVVWYEEYPEVQAVEDVLNRWGEMFQRVGFHKYIFHYEFIRIGEDPDDTDERGTHSKILYVAHSICEQ